MDNYAAQLENCEIYAPHAGMVVYAREGRSNSTEIDEGVIVRQRQRILTLPNLNKMQVKTNIHESVLDQVRAGLPATIRIDAFPDKIYYGVVHDVAVVPASSGWFSSGVKTYDTVVRIDGEVENLKPGMTAVVDMHVDRIKDVMTVPVQAVVQRDRENFCYVQTPQGAKKRTLELGRSNDKFVHIQDGIDVGEQVVLNPMSILEQFETGGGAIAPDSGAPEMPEGLARSLTENREAELSTTADETAKQVGPQAPSESAAGLAPGAGRRPPGAAGRPPGAGGAGPPREGQRAKMAGRQKGSPDAGGGAGTRAVSTSRGET
jgi:hypothetical protein